MKKFCLFALLASFIAAAPAIHAADPHDPLIVTSSNGVKNQLLVYDSDDNLIQTLSTHGQGGVSGNAGGIETQGKLLAVVNFGSNNVAMFERSYQGFYFKQLVWTASSPVSVAFSDDHLYILGTTTVESHCIWGNDVSSSPDGVAPLLKADGSAAQVGVLPGQLIITEKSNIIETVNLAGGAVTGIPTLVMNIPSNVNAPFGLITRGNDAYVTIAHANEISLVRNGDVLTVTSSGTQMAPCWLTLDGPFLFSANSPSMTVSRYAVYGQKIVQDAAVAATFGGDPTDLDHAAGLIAVIDGAGALSHLSIFHVDEDGNLTLKAVTTISGPANGVKVVRQDD